ncbi:hypothetical protein [Streptomyces sp. NPDC005548]|uniref:hypothetical protein n=1 Tax=Streptomyces sp. NPDC005548 TaxID=3364724 RepID=UPI0036CE08EE
MAVPAMFGSEHQFDLGCAVDDVLTGERDVTGRGPVRDQDEEGLPLIIVAVTLDALTGGAAAVLDLLWRLVDRRVPA